MKKIFTIAAALFMTANVWAQAPEKMSYQAVVRNSSDALVTSQAVGMQISILQGSAAGTAVYTETQTPTTNANGLVSLEIGTGTTSDDFSAIDWSANAYFIKTETDPTGGTNYTITGTSQLLSVSYALHAKTAESVANGFSGDYNDLINQPTIPTVPSNVSDFTNDAGYLTSFTEVDGSVTNEIELPTSGNAGDMAYWNGTAWVTVAATANEGATLQLIGGVPTWTGGTPPPTPNVTNPTTGEIWMDRNLGASQVATSSTDANAYGDLYQWGRAADGHESRTSSTTTTLATSDTPGHGDFITNGSSPYDWRNPQNNNLWQGVSGTNNPCPSGYRLPTDVEWEAERTSWSSNNAAGAFASPLKLPLAGLRSNSDGSLSTVGGIGFYWSSTVDGTSSRYLGFYSSDAVMYSDSRAFGFSVRCLKD